MSNWLIFSKKAFIAIWLLLMLVSIYQYNTNWQLVSAIQAQEFPGAPFMMQARDLEDRRFLQPQETTSYNRGFSSDRIPKKDITPLHALSRNFENDILALGKDMESQGIGGALEKIAKKRVGYISDTFLQKLKLKPIDYDFDVDEREPSLDLYLKRVTEKTYTLSSKLITSNSERFINELIGGNNQLDLARARDEIFVDLGKIALDTGLEIARLSDVHGLAHMEMDYTFSTDGKPTWTFLTVQPFYETADQVHNFFGQFSMTRSSAQSTYNAGVAYRTLTIDKNWLIGPNAFFDYTSYRDHTRASLGFDAKTERFGISANRYFRLKDWKDGRFGYEERASSGYDIELSGRLPIKPNFEVYARKYHWWQENTENLKGHEVAVEYSPNAVVRTRFTLGDSNLEKPYAAFGVQFRYRFGIPIREQIKSVPLSSSNVIDRRYEKVRRDNTIRTQERLKEQVRGTIIETVGNNTYMVDGLTVPASSNSILPIPTRISVENAIGAILRIRFGDGAILTIGQGSEVEINLGEIILVSGLLQYTSGDVNRIVAVPGGTVELLGTDIDVRTSGASSTVRVRDGAIRATGPQGAPYLAQAREMVLLGVEAAPLDPNSSEFNQHVEDISVKIDRVATPIKDSKVAAYPIAPPRLVQNGSVNNELVTFGLTYSKPVTVIGQPLLKLTINGVERRATYVSGSGTNELVFGYSLPAQ